MTSILERIQADVKQAMKDRDAARVQVLRMFVNALQVEAKSKLRDLETVEEIAVLQRAKKQRIEAAEAFEAGGHGDRAAQEREQARMLEAYLPEQLAPQELTELVRAAVAETGASGPKDMGTVMKVVVPRVAGRADGKVVSAAVQAVLRGDD